MISIWMLYSTGIALLLGLAALAAERAFLATGRPTRWVWTAALAGSLLLPPVLAWMPAGDLSSAATPSSAMVVGAETMSAPVRALSTPPASPPASRLERALGYFWLLGSTLLAAAVLLSALSLERKRRGWRHGIVGGRAVLVSRDTGPAVVGFLWPEVVVPDWVLSWDEESQRLLLEHEREHERAGDPHLLLAAMLAVVLTPWNLPLWWQARRLRLAIEVDCDARVLRRRPGARTYGHLLIEVARLASSVRVPVAAFSESRSFLERRIRILAGSGHRPRRSVLLVLWAVVALAPVAVYAIPTPQQPDLGQLWSGTADVGNRNATAPRHLASPGDPPTVEPGSEPTFTPYEVRPELRNRGEFARALERRYPTVLKEAGIGGTVVLWVLIDETGVVRSTRLARSSGHEKLDLAAREALLQAARFTPALNGEDRVPAWIQIPVTWNAPDGSPRTEEVRRIPVATTPPPRVPDASAADSEPPARVPLEARPELLNRREFAQLLAESYPADLKQEGIRGTALFWALIDETGVVTSTRLERSSGHEKLDLVAREVVRQARFAPAWNQGRPVDVWIQVPVTLGPR